MDIVTFISEFPDTQGVLKANLIVNAIAYDLKWVKLAYEHYFNHII
jgi:hypothetical protein